MFSKNRYVCGFSKNNIVLSTSDVTREKTPRRQKRSSNLISRQLLRRFFFPRLSRDDPHRFNGNTINTYLKQNDEMEGRGLKLYVVFRPRPHGNGSEHAARPNVSFRSVFHARKTTFLSLKKKRTHAAHAFR